MRFSFFVNQFNSSFAWASCLLIFHRGQYLSYPNLEGNHSLAGFLVLGLLWKYENCRDLSTLVYQTQVRFSVLVNFNFHEFLVMYTLTFFFILGCYLNCEGFSIDPQLVQI